MPMENTASYEYRDKGHDGLLIKCETMHRARKSQKNAHFTGTNPDVRGDRNN